MADRYWIGGVGNWNDTAHWSTTSGGSGGAAVPTSSDDVYVNSSSGFTTHSQKLTINIAADCLNFSFTSPNGGLSGSQTLTVYGNFTVTTDYDDLSSGVFFGSDFTFSGTGSHTISVASVFGFTKFGAVIFNGGGTYTLQDNMTVVANDMITIDSGTFNTNGYSLTVDAIEVNGTSSLIFGSSSITICGQLNSGDIFKVASTATLNAGTSTVYFRPTNENFTGGSGGDGGNPSKILLNGKSLYNVVFRYGATFYGTTYVRMSTNGTFNRVTIEPGCKIKWTAGVITTIADMLIALGSPSFPITFSSETPGSAYTVSVGGTVSTDYVNVTDSTASGASAPFYNPNGTNGGGNTSWNFTTSPAADSSKHRAALLFFEDM